MEQFGLTMLWPETKCETSKSEIKGLMKAFHVDTQRPFSYTLFSQW